MSWVAAVVGGSAVIGGGLSYLSSKNQKDAAKKSEKSQLKGADAATQAQLEIYYRSREDLAPWMETGERALEGFEGDMDLYRQAIMDPNKYVESPAYNFLLTSGVDAVNRGASARGSLDSGKTDKDLMEFGQGLAATGYGDYVNRLGNLLNRYAATAGMGQTAANQTGILGANAATQMGSNSIYAGNAQAAGQVAQANATTGLYNNISNIGSNAINQLMLNNYLTPSSTPTYNTGYGTGSRNTGQSAGYR